MKEGAGRVAEGTQKMPPGIGSEARAAPATWNHGSLP